MNLKTLINKMLDKIKEVETTIKDNKTKIKLLIYTLGFVDYIFL